ncbi:MAG: CARDB domain-containing protein [Syntrophales bacterium]
MGRFASAIRLLAFILSVLFVFPAVAPGQDARHVVTRCGVTEFTSDNLVVEEFEAIGAPACPTCEYYKDGFYRVYADAGNCTKGALWIDGGYKDNLRDGTWTSGNSFETFRTGLLHGPKETRDSSGKLIFQGSYWEGSPDGVHTWYYDSGRKESEWTYSRGLYSGPHRVWYDDPGGQLQEETGWSGNKEDGPSTGWFENGQMQFQGTYRQGLLVGPFSYWDQWGKLTDEWFFSSAGLDCGVWKYYPPYGAPQERDTGVPCAGYQVTKEPYPDPEVVPAELRGHVRDKETGSPISGALVQAGALQTTSNAEGFYALRFAEQASVTVSVSKDGYYTRTGAFDLTGYEYRTANCALKPIRVTEKPAITEVKSQYGNFFLQSVTVNNAYAVAVDWNGADPGSIRFTLNGRTFTEPASASGGVRSFNMGSDFIAGLSGTTNTLTIVAVNSEGVESDPERLHPIMIPLPAWSTNLGVFGELKPDKGFLTYSLSKSWPAEPVEIQINEKTLGSFLWKTWGLMPFVGGRAFGIPGTQIGLDVEAKTDGSGSVACTGNTGFEAAGQSIAGKLGGKGNLQFEVGKGLAWKGASALIGIEGTIEKEVGPVTLIPALEGAVTLPLIGRPIRWFNDLAKIQGQVKLGADLDIQVIDEKGALGFQKTEGIITDEISLGTSMEISKLKAEVSGGGTAKLTWQVPASLGYLKSLESELFAKASFSAWMFTQEFDQTHQFNYPEGASPTALSMPLSIAGFAPISRDFLKRQPYNRFAALSALRTPSAVSEPAAQTLVQNVYPLTEPALDEKNGVLAVAYVYFDPEKPTVQATEISFTYNDGGGFTTPAVIEANSRAEFAPAIAFDSQGKVVAAWERVKAENFTGQSIADMAPLLEIVYAVFNPAARSWSTPMAITDNTVLDHSPVLRRAADGSLLLLWQRNTAGEIIGSTTSPTTLHTAIWNGAAFSAPEAIPHDFIDSTGFSLAYRGNGAVIAYSRDMDGDFVTTDDQELFAIIHDGSAWGNPVRLTDNAVPDVGPQTAYRNDGTPELLWIQGADLVRLTDWAQPAATMVRNGNLAKPFPEFRLAKDGSDRLAVLWQGLDETGPDLFFSFFDPIGETWSADRRLTRGTDLKVSPTMRLANDGRLHTAYVSKNKALSTADLAYLPYTLSRDLAISSTDLSVLPGNPPPGTVAELACTIHNAGDLPLSAVTVAFYLGDPANGGLFIGSGPVSPDPLTGGNKGRASTAWTVPAGAADYTVFASVDPAGAIDESDETNNKASFPALLPDLMSVQSLAAQNPDGTITLTAVVENAGFAAARQVKVMFRANGVDMGYRIIPAVLPGLRAEVSHTWLPGIDFTGLMLQLETIVDPENAIVEIRKDNNSARTPFFLAEASEPAFDFRDVAIGSVGATRIFTFTNTGARPLTLGQAVLMGGQAAAFSILVDGCSEKTLGSSESCALEVKFVPTLSGSYTAEIHLPQADGTAGFIIGIDGLGLNRGDVDGSGVIDLADAVIVLQLLSGQATANVYAGAAVTGGGKIGIGEVVALLQRLAGLRTPE